MSRHQALAYSIQENNMEEGRAFLMTSSPERIACIGTVDTPDLIDFLETIFRADPGMKSVFDEALERSECPLS